MTEYMLSNPIHAVQFAEIFVYSTGAASLSVSYRHADYPASFGPFRTLTAAKKYYTKHCQSTKLHPTPKWVLVNK